MFVKQYIKRKRAPRGAPLSQLAYASLPVEHVLDSARPGRHLLIEEFGHHVDGGDTDQKSENDRRPHETGLCRIGTHDDPPLRSPVRATRLLILI